MFAGTLGLLEATFITDLSSELIYLGIFEESSLISSKKGHLTAISPISISQS